MSRGKQRLILMVGVSSKEQEWLSRVEGARFRFEDLGDFAEADDPFLCRPSKFVREAVAEARRRFPHAAGVVAFDDYPASLLSLAVANRLKLPGASLQSALTASHKVWSRVFQRKAAGQSVPRFQIIDPSRDYRADDLKLAFPFWLKPVKGAMSFLGHRINNLEEFRAAQEKAQRELPPYARAFNEMLALSPAPINGRYSAVSGSWLIAEELMSGHQCTLDGLMENGRFRLLGIVDAVRLPNRVSFARFELPSRLPRRVQQQMADIAGRVMLQLGYRHGLFNMEFFADPRGGEPKIIEVNPRLSPQFTDLYANVSGRSLYQHVVHAAAGLPIPAGADKSVFTYSASCVLRRADDCLVRRVPSQRRLRQVKKKIPGTDVVLTAEEGDRLSDLMQDSYSFRYGWINLGATSRADLRRRYLRALKMLKFDFVPLRNGAEAKPAAKNGRRKPGSAG
ncbi:MAG: acetyl-CoA carboxylase biotin carboxylase subunit family protein [Dongiaceae bacterium]